eukprot:scaffold26581_cov26-Cyclotella_meneghiniana.AAC.2
MSDRCASCGKADANLKACKACKLVKYCGVECQVAHRPAHKKACREKARELFDVQLYAQPPRKEECPICMIPLPCRDDESFYMNCCGKHICIGCRYCLTRQHCPFCNTAAALSDEEVIKRLLERIEKYNDPEAMNSLACSYMNGLDGLPVDRSKAFELFQRACRLESAAGHCHLGTRYLKGGGTEIDKKKAVYHLQIAAMMGNVNARHNLGCAEEENGNFQRAMRHFMIAAKCGFENSLDAVKDGFRQGDVTKEDLEKTLRDYQASCDETKSEQRDRAAVMIAQEGE